MKRIFGFFFYLAFLGSFAIAEVQKISPSGLSGAARQGVEFFLAQKYREAGQLLVEELKNGNRDERVAYAVYKIHFFAEEYDEAKKCFETQPGIQRYADVLQDQAFILLDDGDVKNAEALLLRSERNDRFFAIQLRLLEKKKDWTQILNILGSQKNRLTDKDYRIYLDLVRASYDDQIAEARKKGDLDQAVLLCREILRVEKKTATEILLANLYYLRGETDLALSVLPVPPAAKNQGQPNEFSYLLLKLRGMIFCRQKKWDDALEALRAAMATGSQDEDLFYYLSQASYQTQNLPDALSWNDRLLKMKKPGKETWFLRAQITVAMNDYPRARESLARYIELAPDDEKAAATLKKIQAYLFFDEGKAAYEKGNVQTAVERFENALNLFPQPAPAMAKMMLANSLYLLATKKKPEEASPLFARAELLVSPLVKDPSLFPQLYDLLQNIYGRQNDTEKMSELTRLREKIMQNADDRYYFDVGYQYELQKKYEAALTNYSKSLELGKGKAEAKGKVVRMLVNLATAELNAADEEGAAKRLERAESLLPKDADVARLKKVIQVRKLRAMIAEKMTEGEKALAASENEKALALFVEIEGLDPETPDLRGNLATAYYRTGRYSKAILYYRSEYEKNENFFSALGSLYCLYNLGKYGDLLDEAQRVQNRYGGRDETEELVKVMVMAYRALAQRGNAIDLLTAARARDASRADYAILLGNLYFEQKDFEKAQELYEAVYQSSRNNFVVVYNLGVLHLKKGRVEKSLFYLSQAVSLIDPKKKPELAESLAFQLAQVHYRMRAFREAEKQIENAAEFYAATPEGKKGPNLNYAYWYANIFSRTPASFSNETIHKKIFSNLDLCIGQSDDRELSARASYLKVILDPETRVFLKNPVKTLSDRTPVAISDLLVYQNRSNEIVAQNELSGKVVWRIPEQSSLSTPFVHEGQFIAYGLEGGVVHVVEEVGGRTVLRAREYARDLALEGGNVIALGQSLTSLNARGTNFQIPLTNLGMSRLVTSPGFLGGMASNRIFLFRSLDGKKIGELAAPAFLQSGFGESSFYAVSFADNKASLHVLSLPDGRIEPPRILPVTNASGNEWLFSDKNLYSVRKDGQVTALQIPECRVVWTVSRNNPVSGALLYAGNLYLASQGKIIKIRGEDGKVLWEQDGGSKQDGIYTLLVHK